MVKDGEQGDENGLFFYNLLELGSNPPHVVQSVYQDTLTGLLEPLVEDRKKRFHIREVTTHPTTYIEEAGWIEVQIPAVEFLEFLRAYRERTRDVVFPEEPYSD